MSDEAMTRLIDDLRAERGRPRDKRDTDANDTALDWCIRRTELASDAWEEGRLQQAADIMQASARHVIDDWSHASSLGQQLLGLAHGMSRAASRK